MLIRFLKNNSPSFFILLPIFALVLWMAGSFSGQNAVIQHSMPLYEIFAKPLVVIPFIGVLTALILVICEAFLWNYIISENEVLPSRSFLPALFYIVFMSSDKAMLNLHPLIFANFFILLAINKLFNSYLKDNIFSLAFDSGMLFSIATLFYFPSIVFMPVLYIGLVIFRPFNWREWIISFIGVLVPYMFVITYYFWNDTLGDLWYDKIYYPIHRKKFEFDYSFRFYFMLAVSGIIGIISIGKLFTYLTRASRKSIKSIFLLIWISIFALLSVFRSPEISAKYFSFLAIPISVFCANYFLRVKREWLGGLLFILLITAVFIHLLANHF